MCLIIHFLAFDISNNLMTVMGMGIGNSGIGKKWEWFLTWEWVGMETEIVLPAPLDSRAQHITCILHTNQTRSAAMKVVVLYCGNLLTFCAETSESFGQQRQFVNSVEPGSEFSIVQVKDNADKLIKLYGKTGHSLVTLSQLYKPKL